jgi:serine/threonine protein kinase
MAKKKLIFHTASGSYNHLDIIGEGGSGRVFKVEDENEDIFAIKCIHPENLTQKRRKRFRNELSFCHGNDHKNIVKVLDWGSVEIKGKQCPFYVMPYYPATLRTLMKEGIESNQILVYFSQILDGVEAAHLQSIWHRDLKPENILYDPSSNLLVLADFGIARFSEELLHTSIETQDTERLANFQYSAPEQRVRGQAVDYRADIYALGLILNEMFTGALLQGTGYIKITDVASNYPYLDDLIEEMVRQSPEDRPSSIEKIKNELIGRKNDFVSKQKLNNLKKRVIPTSEIVDPLIDDPIRLIGVDYRDGNLIFILSRPHNGKWIQAFQNIDYRYALLGSEPRSFQFFDDNKAKIKIEEHYAQKLIDNFKRYIESANESYKTIVNRQKKEQEVAERRRLQAEIEEKERRQRVLKSVNI